MPRRPTEPPHTLQGVERTLLMPMIVRARAAMLCPWLDPQDARAGEALAHSGSAWPGPPADAASIVNILWRTRMIKAIGQDFFDRFPHVQGINLGAGLSDYFQWLDNGQNRWTDVDLPEVIDLRRNWLSGHTPRHESLSDDLRTPGWWTRLGLQRHNHHNPLLLVCEGVLMYLQPTQVAQFFREIGEHAPEGSELLCDFISPAGIGHTLPANHHPQEPAPFTWGAHSGMEMAQFHPRLELLDQHSVAEAYGWGASWLEGLWAPLTGGPLYGLAHLKVSDDL